MSPHQLLLQRLIIVLSGVGISGMLVGMLAAMWIDVRRYRADAASWISGIGLAIMTMVFLVAIWGGFVPFLWNGLP